MFTREVGFQGGQVGVSPVPIRWGNRDPVHECNAHRLSYDPNTDSNGAVIVQNFRQGATSFFGRN